MRLISILTIRGNLVVGEVKRKPRP